VATHPVGSEKSIEDQTKKRIDNETPMKLKILINKHC
jgi:hypothetical protein